ncbi:MAG: HAMP domain-containing histidine kinase [Coriobacteriales bacterium]|nr:HAMP domain-containing histidine kinase [Coriobacteriales bacterium]
MVLTSLVLVAAFTAVYVATSVSVQAQNQRDLASLADISVIVSASDEGSSSLPPPQEEGPSGAVIHDERGDVVTVTGTASALSASLSTFAVTVDKSGSILAIDSPLDLSQEAYEQAVTQAWENPDGAIFELLDRQWLYAITFAGSHAVANAANEVVVTTSENSLIRFLDVTESQTALRNLLLTLIAVGLAALVAVWAVSLLFANRSIKPIAQAWEQQRRFVADASHELKTPLAIITTNSDALLANQEQTIASQREWLDYLRIGSDRMSSLIDELLTFARVENADVAAAQPEPVNLSATVQMVLQSLSAATEARQLQVTMDIEPGLTRVLVPGLIDKVFFALLENAVKYADEGGQIEVRLRSAGSLDSLDSADSTGSTNPADSAGTAGSANPADSAGSTDLDNSADSIDSTGSAGSVGSAASAHPTALADSADSTEGGVFFMVENSGPGIAEDELPHIFERFYRADSARRGDAKSFGLGLSIAKEAVRRLGARIDVQSDADKFTRKIPLCRLGTLE